MPNIFTFQFDPYASSQFSGGKFNVIRRLQICVQIHLVTQILLFLDEDEFDTMDYGSTQAVACRCEAIYDYEANQSDELTIRPGN